MAIIGRASAVRRDRPYPSVRPLHQYQESGAGGEMDDFGASGRWRRRRPSSRTPVEFPAQHAVGRTVYFKSASIFDAKRADWRGRDLIFGAAAALSRAPSLSTAPTSSSIPGAWIAGEPATPAPTMPAQFSGGDRRPDAPRHSCPSRRRHRRELRRRSAPTCIRRCRLCVPRRPALAGSCAKSDAAATGFMARRGVSGRLKCRRQMRATSGWYTMCRGRLSAPTAARRPDYVECGASRTAAGP